MRLRNILSGLLFTAIVAAVVESQVRGEAQWIAREPIDLSSESTFLAKVSALRRIEQQKVVVIGDSVVHGDTMAKHGRIPSWRELTLSRQLADFLGAEQNSVVVSNFAINGARPLDMLVMVERALEAGAASIVLVIGARAFSADFERHGDRFVYPWLRAYDSNAVADAMHTRSGFVGSASEYRLWSAGVIGGAVRLLLGGPLNGVIANSRLRLATNIDPSVTLLEELKVRNRFRSAAVESERIQTQAFVRILKRLNQTRCGSAIVYAAENPSAISSVFKDTPLEEIQKDLAKLTKLHAPDSVFIAPPSDRHDEHYIDYVHPTPAGYTLMARRIIELQQRITCADS